MQRVAQLEPQIDGLLAPRAILGQMGESLQRLLEVRDRLEMSRARGGLGAGLARVLDRLLPELSSRGVMGEPTDVFEQAVRVARLDGEDDAGVEPPAALRSEALVGDLVGERVPEAILDLRERC